MDEKISVNTIKEYLSNIGKWEDFTTFLKQTQNVTLVTGLWDLGRSKLNGWAQRDFETYKQNFFKLLEIDVPMCIWIPSDLESEIWNIRSSRNTQVYIKEVEEFKTWFPFFEKHEQIRTNPNWYNSAGWLPESPQAALELYNPMMMTKMFMVNDSALKNPFNTDYFYWVDGGLTSTVSSELLKNTNIYQNISKVYKDRIVHITYPYEPSNEIHGYDKKHFYKECNLDQNEKTVLISRGGFWGGPKNLIHEYNSLYYQLMHDTIESGNIGADECLFTIAAYRYPHLIERYVIESNGLVYPFFEKIQDTKNFLEERKKNRVLTESNALVSLYILGFNSPEQFKTVCESIKLSQPTLFEKTKKILINNSTDESTFTQYDELCTLYDFEEIHKENLGVCGGRQFAAEHFEESDSDFYMFFEDDMNLVELNSEEVFCRNGFRKYVPNLYDKLLKIMIKEKFDFLKLAFSEFYGDNSTQWAWYNVPQNVRTENWPDYDKLPEQGTDPNAPKTKFDTIHVVDELPYIKGEIYYSNWPQIVSRDGNKKMFLDTKWPHPYEQTWMSHMYQLTKKKQLTAGILLASTVNHHRFHFYEGTLRKES